MDLEKIKANLKEKTPKREGGVNWDLKNLFKHNKFKHKMSKYKNIR